jgi:uncharacterized beta-barrel protein YwiB (DUF1934 family)
MKEDGNSQEFKVVGKMNIYNDYSELEYTEPDTKMKAVYKIYNDKLELTRKGSLYMETVFIKGMSTNCKVVTEFDYEMNLDLNTFYYNIEKDNDYNINVYVKYNLDIDIDNIHELTLEIKNKNISIAKK